MVQSFNEMAYRSPADSSSPTTRSTSPLPYAVDTMSPATRGVAMAAAEALATFSAAIVGADSISAEQFDNRGCRSLLCCERELFS